MTKILNLIKENLKDYMNEENEDKRHEMFLDRIREVLRKRN